MAIYTGYTKQEDQIIRQMIVRGMGEDQPSAEFEAYSIQNIAQKLINAYKLK